MGLLPMFCENACRLFDASLRVTDASKPNASGAIIRWGHEQNLAVLIVAIGLRKIPDRTLRLIVAAAAHDGSSSVIILELIGPLPYVAYQILHTVGAGPLRVCSDGFRAVHGST